MNKLFSDKIMVKLNKVPTFVWVLILAATMFFANAYVTIDGARTVTKMAIDAYKEAGVNINSIGMAVVTGIFVTAIYVALFELIARWFIQMLIRRFFLEIGVKELMLQVRLILIICNIFIGIFGIVYFFSFDIGNLVNVITEFLILAFIYGWYYEYFRKKYLNSRFQSSLFVYIARLFIGIFLIISVYNFFYYLVMIESNLTTIEIISLTLDLIIKIGVAFGAYFYNKHLKKCVVEDNSFNPSSTKNGEININFDPFDIDKDNNIKEEKKEDKIFDDFDL